MPKRDAEVEGPISELVGRIANNSYNNILLEGSSMREEYPKLK